ncbi:MAG: hypothetical protein EBS41_01190 [Actinobacteria bacterium]|nr:hypothetical protein [Actinomycetota bacterium]
MLALAVIAAVAVGVQPAISAPLTGWMYTVARGGAWLPDTTAPLEHVLVDGDAIAWTYGRISSASATPAAPASFQRLCPKLASEVASVKNVRVAVVIDSHMALRQAANPTRTTCLKVAPGLTASEALTRAATSVRLSGVLVCAIDDIPAQGCLEMYGSDVAASSPPRPNTSQAPSSAPPSSSPTAMMPPTPTTTPTAQIQPNALINTPRAWLLSGGLMLLALGLASARRRYPR